MTLPERVNVLGVGISVLNLKSATDLVENAAEQSGSSSYVTVTGVHGVVESQKDLELKKIHNRSLLTTPDGMPMVWLGKHAGHRSMDRVYGPDLVLSVVESGLVSSKKHYLFGGCEGVAADLGCYLRKKFPEVQVVGVNCPPFRELTQEEEEALVKELQNVQPHYIWIGLGTPKQERFMHDFLSKYPDLTKNWAHGSVMLGVGAAFDFHTGRVRQAPLWVQRSGFEWLFRVCMDPKRLWRRYAYSLSYFLRHIFFQLMGSKDYPMPK